MGKTGRPKPTAAIYRHSRAPKRDSGYYCPTCGRTISNGYRGSLCFHGGNGAPTRMKPAKDQTGGPDG